MNGGMNEPLRRISLQRIKVPVMRWPGPWIWGGLVLALAFIALSITLSTNNTSWMVLIWLVVGSIVFTTSLGLDATSRLHSLKHKSRTADIELARVPPIPSPPKLEGDPIAEARYEGEFRAFVDASPFHVYAGMFGPPKKVFVGKIPGLARETWVAIGTGHGKNDGQFGVAVRSGQSGSTIFIDPKRHPGQFKKRGKQSVISGDEAFDDHWCIQAETKELLARVITPEIRSILMNEYALPHGFWTLRLPFAGDWIFGDEWVIHRRQGYPSVKHLLQLGEWINKVADVYESNRANQP